MKMGPGAFWGMFLILIGLALIIKVVLHIDLPVFKLVFALFFILIGIKILLSDFRFKKFRSDGNDIVFGEMHINGDNMVYDEYNVVFGKGIFDLRDIDLNTSGSKFIKIACVFGSADIIMNDSIPVKITTESVFSGGRMPDGNNAPFGTSTYISPNYDPLRPNLNLRIEAVFSGIEVKKRTF